MIKDPWVIIYFMIQITNFCTYVRNANLIDNLIKSPITQLLVIMFVCLGYFVPLVNFSLILKCHHCRWSLTYARHSWLLSWEGSLGCHTYCDTGHPFITVFSEDPWQSHLLPNIWQWSCHNLFLLKLNLRSVVAGIRTPNLPHSRLTLLSNSPPPRLSSCYWNYSLSFRQLTYNHITYM